MIYPNETPTEEGKRRWPPDGYYDKIFPCTCKPECPEGTSHTSMLQSGACRCDACTAAETDMWESD